MHAVSTYRSQGAPFPRCCHRAWCVRSGPQAGLVAQCGALTMICCLGSLIPPARCRSSCAGRDLAGPEPGWLQRTSLGDEVTGREEKSCCITHPADEGKRSGVGGGEVSSNQTPKQRQSAPAQCSQHQQGPPSALHSQPSRHGTRLHPSPEHPTRRRPMQGAHLAWFLRSPEPAAPSVACAPASRVDALSHDRQAPERLAQQPESFVGPHASLGLSTLHSDSACSFGALRDPVSETHLAKPTQEPL